MEIPVIHEVTMTSQPSNRRMPNTRTSSSRLVTSPHTSGGAQTSSLTPSTNHFLRLSKIPPRGLNSVKTGGKPGLQRNSSLRSEQNSHLTSTSSSPASSTASSSSNSNGTVTSRGSHSRLPSTDSGISDGFDSLSRYRGKNFLSSSIHGDLTPEEHHTGNDLVFVTSPDYNRGDQSGVTNYNVYASLPRRKTSSPLTTVTRGSCRSPLSVSLSSPRQSVDVSHSTSSRTGPGLERTLSPRSSVVLEGVSSPRSSIILDESFSPTDHPFSPSSSFSSSRPISPSSDSTTLSPRVQSPLSFTSTNSSPSNRVVIDQTGSQSGVRVTPRPDGIRVSIDDGNERTGSRITISQTPKTSSHLWYSPHSEIISTTNQKQDNSNSRATSQSGKGKISVIANPGSTFRVRVSGDGSQISANEETALSPTPGSIILTRPLKIDSTPTHAQTAPTSKPKPQVLPRTLFNSPSPSPKLKPINSTHRLSSPLSRRTEIPVKHVDTCTAKLRSPMIGRRSVTPNSTKMSPIDQIYEDVKMLRDSFRFEDEDEKIQHGDLIMKQSNDLIQDVVQLLEKSSLGPNQRSRSSLWPGERGGEGGGVKVNIPVVDLRKGQGVNEGNVVEVKVEGQGNSLKGQSSESQGRLLEMSKSCDSWEERKKRMDSALIWLKTELADLRAMDSDLISQFQRCQETIDTLKSQREFWDCLCEEDEAEYWDDMEINEFNRRYLDSPSSSCSQLSPGSPDMTSFTLPAQSLHCAPDSAQKAQSPWREVTANVKGLHRSVTSPPTQRPMTSSPPQSSVTSADKENSSRRQVASRLDSPRKGNSPLKEIISRLGSSKKERSPIKDVEVTL